MSSQVAMCCPDPCPEIVAIMGETGKKCNDEMVEKALRMTNVSHRLLIVKESHRERMTRLSPVRRRIVKASKPGKRLGSIEGVNAAKQGSRRGKTVDAEAVEPRRNLDAIASVQAINARARLDEATYSKVAESRGKDGATTISQVVNQGAMCGETVGVKAVKHKKGPGAIARDKAIKPRVESPLNDKPDGESGEDVCSLDTSSSVKDAKPRIRVEQTRGCKLKMPEVLRAYPSGAESSNVMDEPKIELSKEKDEPRIKGALRVGSIRFISAKESRSQVQEELTMSKEFAELEVNSNLRVRMEEARRGIRLCREKVPMYDDAKNSNDKSSMRGVSYFMDPFHHLAARAEASTAVMGGQVLMGGHEQVVASKGNQVDAKYDAKDREVTCGKGQGKQFVWEDLSAMMKQCRTIKIGVDRFKIHDILFNSSLAQLRKKGKRKLKSSQERPSLAKRRRNGSFEKETKEVEKGESCAPTEPELNPSEECPWRNLQLILSLQNKQIDLQKKVELAFDYVDSIEKEVRSDVDEDDETESLNLHVSLNFSRNLLRAIGNVARNVLSFISDPSLSSNESVFAGEEFELYDVVLDCVSLLFSFQNGLSKENLELWISNIDSVLQLVHKIYAQNLGGGNIGAFAIQFSCVVLEPFAKFLRIHPTRKDKFRDFVDKLLEPLLLLLDDVLYSQVKENNSVLTKKLSVLVEDVLSHGLFHPVHIDGFLGLRGVEKYAPSVEAKDSNLVIKSYHRHLFDKLESIIKLKKNIVLIGTGQLFHLFVGRIKKRKGALGAGTTGKFGGTRRLEDDLSSDLSTDPSRSSREIPVNNFSSSTYSAESQKSIFDFFVQLLEPLLLEMDGYMQSNLAARVSLVDVHCTLKSVNSLLASFVHEKVYARTEDISEGACLNFLKKAYNTVVSFAAKLLGLSESDIDGKTRKEMFPLLAKELFLAVGHFLDIEYDVIGSDLISLWLMILSYLASFSYLDSPDQCLLTSPILDFGRNLINLYSALRQVNNSIFTLCKAVRLLISHHNECEMRCTGFFSYSASFSNEAIAASVGVLLGSQEFKLSIHHAIKFIPEGQAGELIQQLTEDVSESMEWMKIGSSVTDGKKIGRLHVNDHDKLSFHIQAELLGRVLSEIYMVLLDSISVTSGNCSLLGPSIKKLVSAIYPCISSLGEQNLDGVDTFLFSVIGSISKNMVAGNEKERHGISIQWILVFLFRLYISCRSLYRQVISLTPPSMSRKLSSAMGDAFTAYTGRDWMEKSDWTDNGYFSWIINPSPSLLDLIHHISDTYVKDNIEDCCPLIYILHIMALQRLVDLSRNRSSLEYLLKQNEKLMQVKKFDDADLSLYSKKDRKLKRRMLVLEQEAVELADFVLGYLSLVADNHLSILSSDDTSCETKAHESDKWDFGICSVNKKSLPSAIWNLSSRFCHALENLELLLFSDSLISNRSFDSFPVWSEVLSTLEKSSAIVSGRRYIKHDSDTRSISNKCNGIPSESSMKQKTLPFNNVKDCRSLLNLLCWMPKEYLSSKSFSKLVTCVLHLDRYVVAELLHCQGTLSSYGFYELFQLFVACRRTLKNIIMALCEEKIGVSLSSLITAVEGSYFITWLFKSVSTVIELLDTMSEDCMSDSKIKKFSLMDHTSYVIFAISKYQFGQIVLFIGNSKQACKGFSGVASDQSILNEPVLRFNYLNDNEALRSLTMIAESLKEQAENLIFPLEEVLDNAQVGTEKEAVSINKMSFMVSFFDGFLWGLASALNQAGEKCGESKAKLLRWKFEPLLQLNICINVFVDFISDVLRMFLENDQQPKSGSDSPSSDKLDHCKDSDDLVVLHCLNKHLLLGLLKGDHPERAVLLRQLLITYSAIPRLNFCVDGAQLSSGMAPLIINISRFLLLELANSVEIPPPFTFVWLDGAVKYLEELGSHFPSTDSTLNGDVYAELIELHLMAIGKCISLQGKRATLESHERESSTKILHDDTGLSKSFLSRDSHCLDEFKAKLRMSFKVYIKNPSELQLLSAIQAIERALVGIQGSHARLYEITTGCADGGMVSSTVAAGIDCLDLILEHGSGRKCLNVIRSHIKSFVAALFNIILHLQSPLIFYEKLAGNEGDRTPDPGSVVLMCVEVLTRVSGKHALFQMDMCHVGQCLHIPGELFQDFHQLRISEAPVSINLFLDKQNHNSILSTESHVLDQQFSVNLFAACCRLLYTVLKHQKSECERCIAVLEQSVSFLLHCLETMDDDLVVQKGYFSWDIQKGVKCAGSLRRIYEEIRQQKDMFAGHCYKFLSTYIWVFSGYGPLKTGFRREIDDALKPGVYALIDACSANDLQYLHTVFGEGPCRNTLASLQRDYKLNFQYGGKV
ncbi:Urb2/Npa2, putative isoform 2 [Hibiscus syriacus]|uniref:Urb2/Npa2, putative isoform 2 n=1 Tax=Hibiscus syriacus TaxID=106335 RepID=A0A6A3BVS4_HIBSY|nr:Urb2/Npa2, putative isoform 2 [Hibiscus syriacus]